MHLEGKPSDHICPQVDSEDYIGTEICVERQLYPHTDVQYVFSNLPDGMRS